MLLVNTMFHSTIELFDEAVLIELEAFIPYFKIDCEEILSLLASFIPLTHMEQFPNFYEQTGTGPSERLSAETPRVLGWCHSRSCFRNSLSDFKEELSDWATSLIYLWRFIVLPLHLSCTCVHTYLGQLQGLRNSPLPGFSSSIPLCFPSAGFARALPPHFCPMFSSPLALSMFRRRGTLHHVGVPRHKMALSHLPLLRPRKSSL